MALLGQLRLLMPVLLFPIVALFFLLRYHACEVGSPRGADLLVSSPPPWCCCSPAPPARRAPTSACLAAARWRWRSRSSSSCCGPAAGGGGGAVVVGGRGGVPRAWATSSRPRRPLPSASWGNATFARDSLRGVMAGGALAGAVPTFALWAAAWDSLRLRHPRGPAPCSVRGGTAPLWPGVRAARLQPLPYTLYSVLFARFFLGRPSPAAAARAVGRPGAFVAVLSAVVFWPTVGGSAIAGQPSARPARSGVPGRSSSCATGLLTTLLAALMASVVTSAVAVPPRRRPLLVAAGRRCRSSGSPCRWSPVCASSAPAGVPLPLRGRAAARAAHRRARAPAG